MLTARRAFTLVELLVSIALSGVAAAFMATTLARQQRFYSSAAEILDTRAQLRDAADVLATDLRSAAVELGVPSMRDSAIEMFSVIASSIVCTVATQQSLGMPPLTVVAGNSLTSILAVPDTGDLVLLYTMPSSGADAGRWELRRITSFTSRSVSSACPPATGFTRSADEASGHPSYHVTLATPTVDPVRPGSPLRFVRRSRYSIYRSSDSKWHLGYRRCSAMGPSACAAIQPVSGPYEPYSATASGLSFRFHDRSGVPLGAGATGSELARVDLVVRGRSARHASLGGDSRSAWSDSVVVSVATRNRMP